jgi:hypothetical protein
MIETTINLHADTLGKINEAARARGISRSRVIMHLMKRVMDDISKPEYPGRMVRYQKKSSPENWRTFHLHAKEDEYEYLLDLRKLLKRSVSLILAGAVKKYLGKLKTKNFTDNCLFKDYVLVRDTINGIICWKFIWGFPHGIKNILRI